MAQTIVELAKSLTEQTIQRRRDLHKYPEPAWTEFRTASIVATTLSQLGYEVATGDQVVAAEAMMGVPTPEALAGEAERAIRQGADPAWVKKMHGGKTGVVGTLKLAQPGPTVALRFDMDANDLNEAMVEKHRPFREGFNSVNPGAMHGCGHDGHTSIGLAVAEVLAKIQTPESRGTIKLIFQPGEEGTRGAKAMTEAGVVDDVDFLVGMHLGASLFHTGQFGYRAEGFLATTKVDAEFFGTPAHAGSAPQEGKNALLAAANALINLQAISRHSRGDSRINVGVLNGGSGRNVIPDHALLKYEVRGSNSEVNDYMYQRSLEILAGAAAMADVKVSTKLMGSAAGFKNDAKLAERVKKTAEALGIFSELLVAGGGGSEDCSCFMERVQQHGGQAVYTIVGTEIAAPHHNSFFDFDETALELATIMMASEAADLLKA